MEDNNKQSNLDTPATSKADANPKKGISRRSFIGPTGLGVAVGLALMR